MTKDEHALLLVVAVIMLARHDGSGPNGESERKGLRLALAPFKAEIEAVLGGTII